MRKYLLCFLLLLVFVSQDMAGTRRRRIAFDSTTIALKFYTQKQTGTVTLTFAKVGTQSMTVIAPSGTYTGLTTTPTVSGAGSKSLVCIPPDGMNKLRNIIYSSDSCTGSIPSLTAITALNYFTCSVNQLTGSIPNLTANTALTDFECNYNQLSNYTASTLSTTLTNFMAQTNNLPQSAIDQILADFVTNLASRPGSGTLNISGTGNAAPSNSTNKNLIIAHGWTVTTN